MSFSRMSRHFYQFTWTEKNPGEDKGAPFAFPRGRPPDFQLTDDNERESVVTIGRPILKNSNTYQPTKTLCQTTKLANSKHFDTWW